MKVAYNVFRGEYPFDERVGYVYAPLDKPEEALREAIKLVNFPKPPPDKFLRHPVVGVDLPLKVVQ